MIEPAQEPSEEKPSLFWSIFIIGGANLIIACGFFVAVIPTLFVIGALAVLDILLVVFVFIGVKRHEKVKDKDLSATTFSRKMFNIISGLIFAFFIWLFNPFMALIILLGIDFAFGFHEIVYAVIKKKTYFTDAFIALGRQSEPFKPYLASIMALFGFSIVLCFQTFMFQLHFGSIIFSNIVIIIYVVTILIWGIGDTAAYFAGTRYGDHKLPYNKKKSWEGFFANAAVGTGLGILFFAVFLPLFTTITCTVIIWLPLSLCGGFVGAFFESINLHLDDNFVTVTAVGLILGLLVILLL
jgi:dolichol kinase